jgi:hypothetical protein
MYRTGFEPMTLHLVECNIMYVSDLFNVVVAPHGLGGSILSSGLWTRIGLLQKQCEYMALDCV